MFEELCVCRRDLGDAEFAIGVNFEHAYARQG